MADDNSKVTTNQIVDLEGLFGAPLVATVNADLMAADQFMQFIKEYGFESNDSNDDSDLGTLRMVTFTYDTMDLSGNSKTSVIHIPVLSLMPLPILQVSDASFDFDVKLLAVMDDDGQGIWDSSPNGELPADDSDGDNDDDYAVVATLSPNSSGDQPSASVSANMKVKINMRQADIPTGIASMLNIMDQSVYNTVDSSNSSSNNDSNDSQGETQ